MGHMPFWGVPQSEKAPSKFCVTHPYDVRPAERNRNYSTLGEEGKQGTVLNSCGARAASYEAFLCFHLPSKQCAELIPTL